MRPEDLAHWLSQQPFVPFRINLSNGRSFDVYDPHTVFFWNRNTVLVGELDPDFPFPAMSKSSSVPLIHINCIDPLPTPAPAAA